ncbi:bZIP transcription factor 17 [Punica granatum]|uniref:BZIP domain-containing protein n=2 Tax=Punica granatum TaxID=22663 RepID=A0A218WJT5_PUNGR|nr:bZIP transcription factor 17 [Punica granatum]OWM73097.1 hypothetical protein CDL15_Pgr001211 [Punica granatum]PKI63585.1 hypothetical protein CRG98_016029 [Punica granatum]
MADSTIADPPAAAPLPNSQPADLDSFDIPFDPLFFSAENNPNIADTFNSDFDLDFGLEDNGVFELTFDDLDDLCLPGENEDFIVPDSAGPLAQMNSESGSSGISADHAPDVAAYLNHSPSESGSYRSADQKPDVARSLSVPSMQSGDSGSPEFSGGPVSSQGSGNGGGGFGVSDDMNSPSPECGNSGERDVSSRLFIDQKVKVEQTGKNSVPKRKQEHEDAVTKTELRNSKCRKSSSSSDKSNSACNVDALTEEDEKKKARLMRNRESAQLSRQRKKHYVEELEEKVKSMHSTIADLNSKISFIMAENVSLRQQLGSGGGMCPPPPGMYPPPPMAHMAYPWVPCAPYVMKPQGSQVPLVPIPRLKPQQATSAPKTKKAEARKSEVKTKKLASATFLGLLFCFVLFGYLGPMMDVMSGGIGDRVPGGIGYSIDGVYDHHRGRVLAVTGHRNGTHHPTERGYINDRINCERGRRADESVPLRNGSEPLVASLYVPRNDKLVKIDGNLIIQSVLASEKAKESPEIKNKNDRSTDLVMLRNLASALAIPEARRKRAAHSYVYRNPADRRRALAPGSDDPLKDHIKKSVSANGKVQQWFREGLAGPMLSSGMCSEVFRFDVAPSSAHGAIISAPSVSKITSENRQNSSSQVNKGRNRRSLRGASFRLPGAHFNETGERTGKNPEGENLHQGNKSLSSSMVVSVLMDPREAVDAEVDGVVPPPKSLSRIFVVVLLDSIKYVTYSCVLPRSGGPHLVTT